ncbi:MAG: DUF4340 domain-containing protein [Anaerolineales bacterium]|nr:DUF4340 domain-containing protein [Anaerolineales bacterium]
MKKHNQILAAVLAIQIILIVVVFWPSAPAAGGEDTLILGEIGIDDIQGLTIEDADGNQIELLKSGGNWVLPKSADFIAKQETVTDFLDKLVLINTGRLVTRTDSSHKRLQVSEEDFVRKIKVETSSGETKTLYVGSSPSYGAVHVRLAGQNETYLTSEITSWETNATVSSWIDTGYLRLEKDDVVGITLQNGSGELVFTKDSEGNWSMEGLGEDGELNTSNVSSLATRVTTVNMLKPLGTVEEDYYHIDEPQAVVQIQTADKTITLKVGIKFSEDNSYVVKSSESPYYVLVNEYSVQDLVEKTRADYAQPPATPTPTAEPAG